MSHNPSMGVWGMLFVCRHSLLPHAPMLFFIKAMSKNYINHIGTYNDNHKEITINGANVNVSELVRSFMADDVEPVEVDTPPERHEYFKHFTNKCIDEKRVDAVDAELKAACKGTAEGLWRTLWDNENLGYVAVDSVDATTLYKDIEERYGKLPFKERQFRSARNKRYDN